MNDESMVKSVCMDADDIERAVTRMAHQILEANKGADNIALVGIVTRGDLLAKMLVHKIEEIEGVKVPLGKLDISFYRDDFATHMSPEVHSTDIPFSIDGMTIVLVDDVLYTGRTIRAALDALMDIGRPAAVELAAQCGVSSGELTEMLHILQKEPDRIEHLWDVTNYALKRFREEGFEIGDTESPIIPLYVHDVDKTFLVTKLAYDAGVFINPVIPPACAPQDTLVRFALMATHTKDQVDQAIEILKKIFMDMDLLKK